VRSCPCALFPVQLPAQNAPAPLPGRPQAFDAAAALALLNYRPPPKEASVRAGDEQSPDLVEALQRRSIRAFKYLTPKVWARWSGRWSKHVLVCLRARVRVCVYG
jgi:hypothetical protein